MKNFSTLLFDLDGTLIDSAPDIIAALNRTLNDLGHDGVKYHDFRQSAGDGAKNLLERVLKTKNISLTNRELSSQVKRLLDHYYAIMTDNTTLYPDVSETLYKLREAGIILGICTNRPSPTTKYLLEHFALTSLFSAVLCPDNVIAKKPDPRHLKDAMLKLNSSPNTTLMVGDTATDIAAAHNANVKVVAVAYGYSKISPEELGADAVIEHFKELPQLLPSLY